MTELPVTLPDDIRSLELKYAGEELDRAVRAVRKGEAGAHGQLQECLANLPSSRLSDLIGTTERTILSLYYGDDPLVEEIMRHKLEALVKSLSEPDDGPLEEMLVRRVALTSLLVNHADSVRADRWSRGVDPQVGKFWDKHVSSLNNDFLKASKTLAECRRLTRKTVFNQLNIARSQQINISLESEKLPPTETIDVEAEEE